MSVSWGGGGANVCKLLVGGGGLMSVSYKVLSLISN